MLRGVILAGLLLIGSIIWVHRVLDNGAVVQYFDTHRDPRWIPTAEFYLGQGYYLFQNLTEAATYYQRVPQQYPDSPRADDSYFQYLQTLDDSPGISRQVLIEEYQGYLDRFPKGAHAANIRDRIDTLKVGAH